MKKEIKNLISGVVDIINISVAKYLGSRCRRPNEFINLISYDMVCDDEYLEPVKLKKVYVEDGLVLCTIEDRDGDMEEHYLKDFSLGEIQQIIELL